MGWVVGSPITTYLTVGVFFSHDHFVITGHQRCASLPTSTTARLLRHGAPLPDYRGYTCSFLVSGLTPYKDTTKTTKTTRMPSQFRRQKALSLPTYQPA